jgi:hypothetical protein
MKILLKTAFRIFILLFVSFLHSGTSAMSQDRFDSYNSDIGWKDEMVRLDNFAIYLNKHPEMIGYIGFYVGGKDTTKKVLARSKRAKNYLIHDRGIDNTRIIIINAGKLDSSLRVLQPMPPDMPPDFGP